MVKWPEAIFRKVSVNKNEQQANKSDRFLGVSCKLDRNWIKWDTKNQKKTRFRQSADSYKKIHQFVFGGVLF